MSKRTKLEVGHTYRIAFTDAKTGEHAYACTVTIAPADHKWNDRRASAVPFSPPSHQARAERVGDAAPKP